MAEDTARRCALVCVTGCIAAYKACELVRLLQKGGLRVKVLMSEHATHFVDPLTFRALTHEPVAVGLFDDPSDPIHHISLAQEADIVLVAPGTANIIAKMANGIADDLISTTLLATTAPILVAPAMNVNMWRAAPHKKTSPRLCDAASRSCRQGLAISLAETSLKAGSPIHRISPSTPLPFSIPATCSQVSGS